MALALFFAPLFAAAAYTQELEQVPVFAEVDVCVIGGGVDAVAAACSAADKGAKVFLTTARPYLGDDLCGSQKLWLEEGESVSSEIGKALFPEGRVTTPLTVKSALDRMLIKRGISFLTGSYASDILLNDQKDQAGILMINRSGTQAVRARVVLDFRTWRVNDKIRPRTYSFIVIGGELQSCPASIQSKKVDVEFKNPGSSPKNIGYPVYHYTTTLEWDLTFGSLAKAEQVMRDAVSGVGMVDCSEMLFESGPLLETRIKSGEVAGIAAVVCQRTRPKSTALTVVTPSGIWFDAKIPVFGARNTTQTTTPYEPLKKVEQHFPVLGTYDVVVVGGGTSGSAAGIGAARQGSKTLVIEYLDELGGVGTAGLIGIYWYGIKDGFTAEMDKAILQKEKRWPTKKSDGFNVIQRSEWLRRELLKAGGELWYGAFGCGVAMKDGKVCGVLVATPQGVGIVEAKVVVDSTGNADLADAAGAQTSFGVVSSSGQLAVQLAGYPHRNLGDSVVNTCFALVDDTSVVDIWHLMSSMHAKFASAGKYYDAGQLVDSRERRRIQAEYMLTAVDILTSRRFPDTISHHRSNFDASAFPTCPMLWVKDMKGPVFHVDMPFRSLIPKGVDGLLVTGLGAGAERDAMTLVRMQPDLQNQGYAAGVAAAIAGRAGDGVLRKLDIKDVQAKLVARGILQERVLTDVDSCPMSMSALEEAVRQLAGMKDEIRQQRTVDDPSIFALGAIMLHAEKALPMLRDAYMSAQDRQSKCVYARVLGVLGDSTGLPTLREEIKQATQWDKGFGQTSHRETGNTFSGLDRTVIALGAAGSADAIALLEPLMNALSNSTDLSHYIALSIALKHLNHPKGAVHPLQKHFSEKDFAGHALTTPVDTVTRNINQRVIATDQADGAINQVLRELVVAGMVYQCDPSHAQAKAILESYSRGVEGLYARYANHVLNNTKK
jgi:flavin-dependent dehydrogenase